MPRTGKGRRNLAIVHPISQLGLSLLVTNHRSSIQKLIQKNGTSLYRTHEDRAHDKAFAGLDFRRWEGLVREVCSDHPFVLKADISRFFYTAYTHTLPWAVLGKDKVKEWLVNHRQKLNRHWSNDLDKALQSCQSRETFGIPVGPDTSRIVAEVLMSGVESDREWLAAIEGKTAHRLIDDFIVGFDSEAEANNALSVLRRSLWKYNLQLNDEKTGVFRADSIFRDRWKLEFDTRLAPAYDEQEERREINRLIDLALHLCKEYASGSPAIFTCNRLSRFRLFGNNVEIVVRALLRFARDFPASTSHVAAFLINHQSACNRPPIRALIERWVRESVRRGGPGSYEFELVWSLVVSAVFRIQITEEELQPFDQVPSSVAFCILGLLRERGLLSVPLSRWSWRAEFKKSGIYGENWLPVYEAVRRKWTSDQAIRSAVTADWLFNDMLSQNVTFIEDKVLDASELDVNRRVFRRHVDEHLVEIGEEE